MNNNNRTLSACHGLMLWAAATTVFSADTAVIAEDIKPAEAHVSRAQAQLQERFIREFSGFAGSAENAQSLYSGLRTGSRITLTTPTTHRNQIAGTAVVQFHALARPMGNGSAFLSMALVRQYLVNFGINQPTPWQVRAALNGGAIIPGNGSSQPVVLNGVLAQRAEGRGWSFIAKASGFSLGKVLHAQLNQSPDVVVIAGKNTYANVQTATRGSNYAAVPGTPDTMRTSAIVPAPGNRLIAQ